MHGISGTAGWILIFYLPAAIVLVWMERTKKSHESRARQPFTEQPVRMAGESTRDEADRIFESATEDLLILLISGPLAAVVCTVGSDPHRATTIATFFGGISIGSIVVGWRLRKKLLRSWDYRLGAKGEQIVGRELDRLMAQGYRVSSYHDWNFQGVSWGISCP